MYTAGNGVRNCAKYFVKRIFRAFGLEIRRLQTAAPASRASAMPVRKPIDDNVLSALALAFRSPLLSMYHGEPQLGTDGQLHTIDAVTRISPAQGMWLYDLCRVAKPKSTLEIGMAYGYSTLYFLAALANNQIGTHTAVSGTVVARHRTHTWGAVPAVPLDQRTHRQSFSRSRASRVHV